MSERKKWIGIAAGTVLVAAAAGALIYLKTEDITESRETVKKLHTDIETARGTIEGTSALEREVIVLREIADVFEAILPSSEDINNLIQDFYRYSNESQVRPTSFKRVAENTRGRKASDFDRVGYSLTLQGDTFQFLEFLDRIETHDRFMAIPAFSLTSASRQQVEDEGQALHKIQLDVETYSYVPKGAVKAVRIEGYERKRDLLAGEVSRRRSALTLATFNYRGARARRDPWIDPRVPLLSGEEGTLTVPEQIEIVEDLTKRVKTGQSMWAEVPVAANVLEQMVLRSELEEHIVGLEIDLRRIDAEGQITYAPVQKRLTSEVVEPLEVLINEIDTTKIVNGPTREELIQVARAMEEHIEAGEYELAMQAYQMVENTLDLVRDDPARSVLAQDLRQLASDADVLRAFEQIDMSFGGVALIEGRPPVVILNSTSMTVGDLFANELEVRDIRPNEVDFYFRGVILTRAF